MHTRWICVQLCQSSGPSLPYPRWHCGFNGGPLFSVTAPYCIYTHRSQPNHPLCRWSHLYTSFLLFWCVNFDGDLILIYDVFPCPAKHRPSLLGPREAKEGLEVVPPTNGSIDGASSYLKNGNWNLPFNFEVFAVRCRHLAGNRGCGKCKVGR